MTVVAADVAPQLYTSLLIFMHSIRQFAVAYALISTNSHTTAADDFFISRKSVPSPFRPNMFPFKFYVSFSSRRLESVSQRNKDRFFASFNAKKIEISATVVTLLPYPYVFAMVFCAANVCCVCLFSVCVRR